jgi:predicted TIM-barrel fold metal-dependent hydrolase
MNRRTFLYAAAGIAGLHISAEAASIPIIDTHIHLYDPTRPQGVPWPPKDDTILYRPTLPARYRRLTKALGIVGAIEVECSPWLEDNQWVLDLAAKDKIIVGTVGNLEPGKPDFRKHLERFHRNPLFRGIRCGDLWNRDFRGQLAAPDFISDLKALADAGLELDSMPTPALMSDLVRLTDRIPSLRVVLNHMPSVEPPTEPGARSAYESDLRELGKRPQVYVKVSEVLRRVGGQVPDDLNLYRPRLDEFWDIFGEDRLLFASNWPVSDLKAAYPQVLNVVRQYFAGKGQDAAEKFFWKNSSAAYRWVKREPSQPQLRPA